MSERSLKTLQPVLKSLGGESWLRLNPFHLSVLRSMHTRKINFSFLHIVAEFWDPKNHVFRFNTVEISPLPEEFEAILGLQLDSACQIAIPSLEIPDLHSVQYQMARMFSFSPQTTLRHLSGTAITMNSLLNSVVAINQSEVFWPRLLALCLYSQFLLTSLLGDCDLKLLSILDRVESGCNPFPLILAETIHGLDHFAETRRFSGSPMLLEVSPFL